MIVFTSGGQDSYIKGLKKGLATKKITIKVVSTSRIETESESDYENQLLKFYNQQLSDNPDVSGIIFLSQFPRELRKLNIFPEESPPKIALLTGMSPKLSGLIKEGCVDVVVAGTPEVHIIKKGE